MDNAATTKLDERVLKQMMPYLNQMYGNPSGVYDLSKYAHDAVDNARREIAKAINADDNEIFFTSGGTESDNWAIKSLAYEHFKTNKRNKVTGHIIVSPIEHHAVLDTVMWLKQFGIEVSYLPVNSEGIVKVSELEGLIRDDTFAICVMLVNNEIGTIQPTKEIAGLASKYGIPVVCDAVAAFGYIPVDVKALGVDYLSVSAHKLHGPKGVGFLYARKGRICKLMQGGTQEKGLRAGTENVAGIVGLAEAIKITKEGIGCRSEYVRKIRDYLLYKLVNYIPEVRLNGSLKNRVVSNINVSFKDVHGGTLAHILGKEGICVSSGSACTFKDGKPSFVLKAMGLSDREAGFAIRLTLSADNTINEANVVFNEIKQKVDMLRHIVYE